jgi:transcription elongation factor Elf1
MQEVPGSSPGASTNNAAGKEMFEDETVDIACPKCGHMNTILVRELEQSTEAHIVCEGCKAHVKVEAAEFQNRLHKIEDEVEAMETEARQAGRPKPRKGDFQI